MPHCLVAQVIDRGSTCIGSPTINLVASDRVQRIRLPGSAAEITEADDRPVIPTDVLESVVRVEHERVPAQLVADEALCDLGTRFDDMLRPLPFESVVQLRIELPRVGGVAGVCKLLRLEHLVPGGLWPHRA